MRWASGSAKPFSAAAGNQAVKKSRLKQTTRRVVVMFMVTPLILWVGRCLSHRGLAGEHAFISKWPDNKVPCRKDAARCEGRQRLAHAHPTARSLYAIRVGR